MAARPSELSITTSTSAARRWPIPLPPAEITSCIEAPRIAPGLCSPSAQSTASVMFALAGAVGADDHADAGRELEARPLGERLEPLHRDRSQIHALAPRIAQGSRLSRTRRPLD